jgi:hypothetical protein
MKNKYDQLGKRIVVLDTRIEILNIAVVADNPHSFELVMEKSQQGILYRDYPYSKFLEGGKKWFKTGDEKTQLKYEGDIVNGTPNGQGTETYPDGGSYVGEYKDGIPNGQGTLTHPNGEKYEGEFKSNKYHGQGTYTWSDGRKYVGEWKDGKQNGQGTFTWSDGRKNVGEWKNDKHWNGILYDKDGKIIGNYVNGEKQ